MDLIAKGSNVIDFLSNNESLISGKLEKISIYYEEYQLTIDLNIELKYSKKINKVLLKFIGVSEYSLFFNSENFFYNIENYKFLKKENLFYISLDPINDEQIVDTSDNDYIKSADVFLYTSLESK